jgi:hypothetical protein
MLTNSTSVNSGMMEPYALEKEQVFILYKKKERKKERKK